MPSRSCTSAEQREQNSAAEQTPQTRGAEVPWIFEGTLKENVVMKGAFDQQKYFQALHAAALTPDLEILPGADAVMIGSHGIRLSGGQRARVALARAAYLSSSKAVRLPRALECSCRFSDRSDQAPLTCPRVAHVPIVRCK